MQGTTGTRGARRIAAILSLLVDTPQGLGVTNVANQLGLPKSVVHRGLSSLVEFGLLNVDADTRRYLPGPVLVSLGAQALRNSDLGERVYPALQHLVDMTAETAALSIPVGRSRVHIAQVESPKEVKMKLNLGVPSPFYVGATGRTFLAHLPEADREEIISSHLEPFTEHTIVDPQRLRAELQRVVADGVAVSVGELMPDGCAITAPIRDVRGTVVGAVSVCGPASRLTGQIVADIKQLVKATGEAISLDLGWRP